MAWHAFLANKSGTFAIIFALAAFPVLLAVGVAIDYVYASTVKNQLQTAADAAAVGALAEQSVGVIAGLKDVGTGEVTAGTQDATKLFLANLDPKFAPYIVKQEVKVNRNINHFTSDVRFTARVPTSFLSLINKTYIDVSGVAEAEYTPATYVDFYLMLDNSPSMGLAATTADIAVMEKNTPDKCAFACHQLWNPPGQTDNYQIAKALGVNTRINVVIKAVKAMLQTAKETRKYPDQYRMASYSMGPRTDQMKLTNVAEMSDDLDTVGTQTEVIDLMGQAEKGDNGFQNTDFHTMLPSLRKIMGTGGSGRTAADRQKVMFLVSDGVNDGYLPTGCTKKKSGTRCQQPIDQQLCKAIKDNGIRIAALYTTYHPVTKNDWYNQWIAPFQQEIGPAMKACATNGLYFEVSPSQGIEEAMNALFLKVVNMPRLTM